MKKTGWIVLGLICLGLGAAGAALPFLPTMPFLLLAAACFARGSERLHNWFRGTKLYQRHVADYIQTRSMTRKTKWKILLTVTALIGIGCFMTDILHARIAMLVVLVAHYYAFLFRMKTKPEEGGASIQTRLLDLAGSTRRSIFAAVFFRWLGLLSNVAVIASIALFLDQGVQTAPLTQETWYLVAVAVLGIVLRFFCVRQSVRFSGHAGQAVKKELHSKIYDKLHSLGLSYQKEGASSSYVQLAIEGVEQLEGYMGSFLPQLFYSIVAPLTLFVLFVFLEWKVALAMLLCVPLIPLSMLVIRKKAGGMMKRHWGGYTDLGQAFLESLQGLATLKLYDADAKHHTEMNRRAEGFRQATMRVLRMQLASVTVMDFIAYGGAAVGMALGAMAFFANALPFWGAMLVVLLSAEFFLPLRLLGSFFHSSMNGVAAAERIFVLLDKPEPKRKTERVAGNDISFQACSFSYEEGRQALSDVTFVVPGPEFVAIVGESGCGKSTLAGILSGIHKDYTGSVTVGEKELNTLSEESLTRRIALVTYNAYLFKGSVAENLAMGSPDATEEDMKVALQKVQLYDFVAENGGLSMQIAEQAQNLSGGQKQRLALARALLCDAGIYLLDEAFSGVDAESEESMLFMLRELSKEKTILLITHRMAAAQKADRILMLEKGSVLGFDTHAGLYRCCPPYTALCDTQQALEDVGAEKPKEETQCFA